MNEEPYRRRFKDPEEENAPEETAENAGKSRRGTAAGRAFRRGIERGTAGAVRAVLQSVLTAVIVLAALYFGIQYLPDLISGKTQVTDLVAESRLEAIGEFATYQYVYSGVREKTDTRYLLDRIEIPGTTNYQKYAYSGTIKVGYRVSEMKIHVDNLRREIYVTLPEPTVLSNTIEQDTSVYEQVNNIFNPIRGNAIALMEQDIREEELEKAKAAGLFELAAEHARELITDLLSAFDGYTVVYW